jgi:hypothetical protein
MLALAACIPRCIVGREINEPPRAEPSMIKFSPTIIITTESLVVILILLRAFHVI